MAELDDLARLLHRSPTPFTDEETDEKADGENDDEEIDEVEATSSSSSGYNDVDPGDGIQHSVAATDAGGVGEPKETEPDRSKTPGWHDSPTHTELSTTGATLAQSIGTGPVEATGTINGGRKPIPSKTTPRKKLGVIGASTPSPKPHKIGLIGASSRASTLASTSKREDNVMPNESSDHSDLEITANTRREEKKRSLKEEAARPAKKPKRF